MILEVAALDVKHGTEVEFERAFADAIPLISGISGFVSLELHRCIERPRRYLLLVQWRSLEDHTVGFRQSPEYQHWRALLHHFYDPFPTVEHYTSVVTTADGRSRPGGS